MDDQEVGGYFTIPDEIQEQYISWIRASDTFQHISCTKSKRYYISEYLRQIGFTPPAHCTHLLLFTNILGQDDTGQSGDLGGQGLEDRALGTVSAAAVSMGDSFDAGHLWSGGGPRR